MQPEGKNRLLNLDLFECLTGQLNAPQNPDVESIGKRIRAIREEKAVSLAELSRLTGFDTTLLTEIEQGEVQPQLGALVKLSKALDSAFGRLISGTGEKIYSITRKGECRAAERSMTKAGKKHLYSYMSLAPDVQGRHMEALMVQLLTATENEPSVHDGEEFIFVLEGTVLLEIGVERFELEPGDSAYYLGTTPHLISAKVDKATILAVLFQG